MLSTRRAKRWGSFFVVFLVMTLAAIALARRSASVVARYSSDGRADGGYMLTLDAGGRCEIKANRAGSEFEPQGRYRMEGDRCILETRSPPESPLAWLFGFRSKLSRSTNWLVRTNGAEYLVSDQRYVRFTETGNTNLLHDQLRRVGEGR